MYRGFVEQGAGAEDIGMEQGYVMLDYEMRCAERDLGACGACLCLGGRMRWRLGRVG
jgi:hypothetical protein